MINSLVILTTYPHISPLLIKMGIIKRLIPVVYTWFVVESIELHRQILPSSICADGTPGVYYSSSNSSSSDYVVYVNGGGACVNDPSQCDIIEKPFKFGSNGLPETMESFGILSDDVDDNPLFYTFNKVFIHYCTQDMYLMDTVSQDGKFQFRGRPLLEETMNILFGDQDQNVSVLLVGSSAGGVGVFNLVEWMLDSFDSFMDLSVVMDSAFMVDVGKYTNDILEMTKEDPSIAYGPSCSREFQGGPCCIQFGCMMMTGQYPADRLEGTFILQSSQDAIPSGQQYYSSPEIEHIWDAAIYAGKMESELHTLVDIFPSSISLFSHSCLDHTTLLVSGRDECLESGSPGENLSDETECIYDERGENIGLRKSIFLFENNDMASTITLSVDAWNTVQIKNTSVRSSMEYWWEGRGDPDRQFALFDECNDINCNPTCLTGVTPDKRKHTDSVFVWTMVLVVVILSVTVCSVFVFSTIWGLRRITYASRIITRDTDYSVDESCERGIQEQEECRKKNVAPIVEWRSVNYWIHKGGVTGQEKQIIHDSNGSVPGGSLCAILGSSGSGKSTLIDIVSGRRTYGTCSGKILFRGRHISPLSSDYISQVGYMRQLEHVYLDELSVLDNLLFAAMMRHNGNVQEKIEKIKEVIWMTNLADSLSTYASCLSGGLRRRLSLALELLDNRKILFLDEPTSGLDASGSLELIKVLKRLSRVVTIVLSIHQPRQEIWSLFSHSIIMKSGKVIFNGPPHEAMDSIARISDTFVLNRGVKPRCIPDMIMDMLKSVDGKFLFTPVISTDEGIDTLGVISVGKKNHQWDTMSILMARKWRSGYSNKIWFSHSMLLVSTLFISVTLRLLQDVSWSTRLASSTVITSLLPFQLVFTSVLLSTTGALWKLIHMEVGDGIYRPTCAIYFILVDQLAICFISTMMVVCVMFSVFWSYSVDSLPTSPIVVIIQIFCGNFLSSSVSIGLVISLGVSGMEYTRIRTINRSIHSLWAVFSGRLFQISSIPVSVRFLTYMSPNFWLSNFVLRILLDGMDISSSCPHQTVLYCATSYGDVIADQLGVHTFSTGCSLFVLVMMSVFSLSMLVLTLIAKSGFVDIYSCKNHVLTRGNKIGPIYKSATKREVIRS